MFAVFAICDTVFGDDTEMVGTPFETQEEAEAYMAECEADDIEYFGCVPEPYFVDEV
jgi:hypothetical protein